MRINQNISAFNAYRNLSNTNTAMGKSLEKLSSGFRINRAADDASGLVRSEGLRSEIGGTKVAIRTRPGRHQLRADRRGCAERGALDPAAHA